MSAIKNLIETIAKDVVIDWENTEPTDSQGRECDGIATYNGRRYPVELRAFSELGYEQQAAQQIAGMLFR